MVVRRPGDGLDGSDVLGERMHWLEGGQIPHEQFVVVAPGRQILAVRRPLQAAHFLAVTNL